jgi:tRNA nucleotidyltransferase/poly(A) polymerase
MHEFIIKKLCDSGYAAYLVGGAVRDLVSGITPYDYDVVTEAPLNKVKEIFYNQEIKVIGKSFGVCLINGIEVAGYRKDTYFGLSDKNCKIEPAKTLIEDLGRRDFTINAMAFCPYTGDLIDPYSGIVDLRDKIIRFVGNPIDRIYEDPCRILRACRFLSKIDGRFSPQTLDALKEYSYLVREYVAPERIRLEILKALQARKASAFFTALDQIGVLADIFPSLAMAHEDGGPYHAETIFEHSMLVGDAISQKCCLTKLTGYLHDVGKVECRHPDGSFTGHDKVGADLIRVELQALKFATNEINHVCNLIELHMRDINAAKGKGVRRALYRFEEKGVSYIDWLRLKFADATGNKAKGSYSLKQKKDLVLKFENELFSETPAFFVKDLAISGNDVMAILQINPGPEVGRVLNEVFELVLTNPEKNKKEELLTWLQYYKN